MASLSHIGLSNETLFAYECDMVIIISCLMFSLIGIVISCARVKCNNAVRTRASWWCHQMEGFSALLAVCAGDSPVTGEFPSQGPVARSLDVFIDGHSYIMYQGQTCWCSAFARSWWRHQMEIFSALLAACVGVHRPPVNSPHRDQWRGALMFSLMIIIIHLGSNELMQFTRLVMASLNEIIFRVAGSLCGEITGHRSIPRPPPPPPPPPRKGQ